MLNTLTYPPTNLTGVILAGGRATRMGGEDKGLLLLNNKCLIEYIIATLRPQVHNLLISANRHQSRYAELSQGGRVLADTFGHYDGPLAGMATCLQEATTDYVLFVPCDTPFLSPHLASRLYTQLIAQQADLSVATDGQRNHPVIALLKRSLLPSLLKFLDTPDRKISHWYAQHHIAHTDFSDIPDTLLNINTPQDLATISK